MIFGKSLLLKSLSITKEELWISLAYKLPEIMVRGGD
jgi:hypothetical protein